MVNKVVYSESKNASRLAHCTICQIFKLICFLLLVHTVWLHAFDYADDPLVLKCMLNCSSYIIFSVLVLLGGFQE